MKNNEVENKNVDVYTEIELRGKTYRMYFNLNVMQSLQKKYESFDAWIDLVQPKGKKEPDIEALIFGFSEMINEGIDIYNEEHEDKINFFTEKQIGRIITELGIENLNSKLTETVLNATKTQTKN